MIGFVGVGAMGAVMAERLLDAGFPLAVYDVRPEAAAAVVARGAKAAGSPREVSDLATVVFTSLPSPQVAVEVVTGPAGVINGTHLRVLVDVSTIGAPTARNLARQLNDRGVAYVEPRSRAVSAVPSPGP